MSLISEAKYRLALGALVACLIALVAVGAYSFTQSVQIRALTVQSQNLTQEKFQLSNQLATYREQIKQLTIAQEDAEIRRKQAQAEALSRLESAAARLGRINLVKGDDCPAAEAVLDAFSEGR